MNNYNCINSKFMYSMDKYGKLKKQIDRYFLPYQINPNIIIDALKQEQRKIKSPTKNKNSTIHNFNNQINRYDMLKVTGKQFQTNFTPIRLQKTKTRTVTRQKIVISNTQPKEEKRVQIKQILSEPFDEIVDTISKDPEYPMYSKQLSELMKLKGNVSQNQLNLGRFSYIDKNLQNNDDDLEHYQKLIRSNPILYKKIIYAYEMNKIKSQGKNSIYKHSPIKRNQFSDTLKNKKIGIFKPFNEKLLTPHEIKKINCLTQYKQFLMMVNLSNKIYVQPQSDILIKAFICKGNNGILVKSIIKSRPWWCLRSYTDLQNCSFLWSQWKKTKATNNLPLLMTSYQSQIVSLDNSQTVDANKVCEKNEIPLSSKIDHLKKIIKVEDTPLIKYLSDESDINFFTFTKKIHEKSFQDVQKKLFLTTNTVVREIKQTQGNIILNHLPGCLHLHSKRLLFTNLKKYYEKESKNIYDVHPLTFVIANGEEDPQYIRFLQYWKDIETKKGKGKNIWICKPGQNSNRGNGITVVSTLEQVKAQIINKNVTNNRTLLIQKYLEQPFLYNKRKFDIRCFMLITSVNGIIKGYWYSDGYLRTTSKEYNLKNLDNRFIHLTNDAIQKRGQEYGKFENCNKVSFPDFQKYLEPEEAIKFNRETKVQMKKIATDLIASVAYKLNPKKKQFCFEIFGLDFMLDKDLKPLLIEANSNPSLEVDGSILGKIIPSMVENTIKIAVDPLFPPPYSQNPKTTKFVLGNTFEQNRYEIIYDSVYERRFKIGTYEEIPLAEDEEFEEDEVMFENQQNL